MKELSFKNDILPLKNQLYRLALRITLNQQEAEDIVQDTLIKIWNNKERWGEIDSIEAYSMTICRNLSLDHLRLKENQNASLDGMVLERADKHSDPLEEMQQKDNIQQIKAIIDKLPEKQRSCMQLRDFEGMSYKEISQALELTEEQVKINIFRARKAVKKQILDADELGL